ncbi:MAG: hypothetical protein GC160_07225 [Acidobacteria bacterium]|nr:hypothetical protein [Acidobacteriota bacterium]
MKAKHSILMSFMLAAFLATGCPTEQITRTQQNRPTTPASSTATVTVQNGMIPAGTQLALRVDETIDTKQAGGVYRAEVAQTVVDASGRTVIRQGSPAELTVVDASGGGAVGTRKIELALRSITVNGQRQMASSVGREEGGPSGLGANRRTAEMVGGGAALGAVVGAIFGGGSGAATGAAIGAAGGAATQVLTRGDTVRIPAETVMGFQLSAPLRVS